MRGSLEAHNPRGDAVTTSSSHDGVLPGSFLRAALLLLLRERPDHGYDLHLRLVDLGVQTDTGVVYRALRQMEHDGLLVSAWEASGSGPARRAYELTFDGEDHLVQLADLMQHRRKAVQSFIDRYERSHAATPQQ
ncbi:hypothetical protein BH23ACT9_BH23ACT9_15780 [soil metagenome]